MDDQERNTWTVVFTVIKYLATLAIGFLGGSAAASDLM